MGDKPSSGTQSTFSNSNSNSTSTAGPNPYIAGYLQNLVGGEDGAAEWMRDNRWAPAYFPNGTVAPMSDFTNEALNTTWGFGKAGLQGLDASLAPATNYFTDAANGKYLDIANDPNWQAALAASLRPGTENFRDVLAPGIDSTFAGSGRTAGGAHFDTMMRGVSDLTRNQADASVKAASDRYGMERGLQASAAGAIPQLEQARAGLGSGYASLMNNVGATRDAYAQRLLDDQNARFGYDQTAQLDWFNRLSQTLQSMYPGGQTTGQQSGTGSSYGYAPQQQGGGFGSFLSPAMGIAGLGLQAASVFSDERLKEDIKPVGELHDGQTVYSYRYKGEAVTQLGLLAQEVEKVHPEAVSTHPSGYKMVNYAKATPEGDLP